MEDEKGEFTFRKWNYRRPNVEYGENNDDEIEASCPISCFCCFLVESYFKLSFPETVNVVKDGTMTPDQIFSSEELEV